MTILAADRKEYISKHLELMVHRQKRATFEGAFGYLHFFR